MKHLVAQSVKHPTLDFGSDHDLMVCELEPHIGLCIDSVEPAEDSLSPPLPCLFAHVLSLSHKMNKLKTHIKKKKISCTLDPHHLFKVFFNVYFL